MTVSGLTGGQAPPGTLGSSPRQGELGAPARRRPRRERRPPWRAPGKLPGVQRTGVVLQVDPVPEVGLEALAALELPGRPALSEHLEVAHVLQLFPGFDGTAEIGDVGRDVGVLGQEGLAFGWGLLQPGDLGGDLASSGLQELRLGLADSSPSLHGNIEAGTGVLQLGPCLAPGPAAEVPVPGHLLCPLVGDGRVPRGARGLGSGSAGPAAVNRPGSDGGSVYRDPVKASSACWAA